VGIGRREVITATLQALIPQNKTIAIPIEDLQAIRLLVEKDEEMAGQEVPAQLRANERGQTVEATTEVGRSGGAPNLHGGRQGQHDGSRSRSRSCRSQARSVSGCRRRTNPEGKTNSTGAQLVGGTTRTGTKPGVVPAGAALCRRRLQA